ncbi:MAG: hypothetical protein WC107_04830 [Patescibacteria group bacterium]
MLADVFYSHSQTASAAVCSTIELRAKFHAQFIRLSGNLSTIIANISIQSNPMASRILKCYTV